jgi:uncharacterized protein (TIGR03067 family)
MRKLMAAVGLVLAAGWAARAADDDAAKAAKKIEGKYEVMAASRGGQPDEKAKDVKAFVIKGGAIKIETESRNMDAKFTLDPSKKPAHIDIMPEDGGKGETLKGIYQTKETDAGLELTLTFDRRGGDRPTDFKGEGENVMLVKLLRKKAK